MDLGNLSSGNLFSDPCGSFQSGHQATREEKVLNHWLETSGAGLTLAHLARPGTSRFDLAAARTFGAATCPGGFRTPICAIGHWAFGLREFGSRGVDSIWSVSYMGETLTEELPLWPSLKAASRIFSKRHNGYVKARLWNRPAENQLASNRLFDAPLQYKAKQAATSKIL